ncbi:apolipoprotein L3-like [Arvicanthis niloticus]|uniref:apolipoprotein L3-like n=1 Tax=Arvicanthis niloticus TaxID=61156 RepID=UPI00148745A5|nr:apolipoprotein L3-like [Arvicanthis niloticus]
MASAVDSEEMQKVAARIVQESTDFLTEVLSKKDLRSLITEDGAWKGFVEAAELSRDEEAALRDALNEHLAKEPTDKDDRPQREQQKKRFLKEFPKLKKKLGDHIRKLRVLAGHLDKVHKDSTISNVVSSSVSIASGVLGLGLSLASFPVGTSLVLAATSLGLGVTASAASLTTTIVEESIRLSGESEASKLVGASMSILEEILKILPKITVKLSTTGLELVDAFKTLKDTIRAIRAARAISRSGAAARNLTSTAQRLLPMTRRSRIGTEWATSLFLVWDVYHLVNESVDLYNGAKTESAGALRDLALKLEEKLQVFQEFYNKLK